MKTSNKATLLLASSCHRLVTTKPNLLYASIKIRILLTHKTELSLANDTRLHQDGNHRGHQIGDLYFLSGSVLVNNFRSFKEGQLLRVQKGHYKTRKLPSQYSPQEAAFDIVGNIIKKPTNILMKSFNAPSRNSSPLVSGSKLGQNSLKIQFRSSEEDAFHFTIQTSGFKASPFWTPTLVLSKLWHLMCPHPTALNCICPQTPHSA